MTTGAPLRLLVSYAIPSCLGNIFQLLYSMVDAGVMGKLVGAQGFAAVGSASSFTWIITSIVLGFTEGFGILFAQRFGKKDWKGLGQTVAVAALLSAGLAVVLTGGSFLASQPVLSLMNTPADIRPFALIYLRWIFAGTPAVIAYNLVAALLRSLGNSRDAFIAMVISSLCNAALDILFVAGFHWGIKGVAVGTVIAQCIAFLYGMRCLWSVEELKVSFCAFGGSAATAKELLRLGVPAALRNAVINVGGLLVQRGINNYGTLFIAGNTAAQKYLEFLTVATGALDNAFATYSAQNYGAGKLVRIKEGLKTAGRATWFCAVPFAVVAILFSRPLIGLLVTGAPEEQEKILLYGSQNLIVTACFLPVLNFLCLYRSGLQGMGNSFIPMLSSFAELIPRILAVFLLPGWIGYRSIYLAFPLGWMVACLFLGVAYHRTYRQRQMKAFFFPESGA